jgi:hypothetical protein
MTERICERCNSPIPEKRPHTSTHCSDSCRLADQKAADKIRRAIAREARGDAKLKARACEQCGGPFPPHSHKDRQFCSPKCKTANYRDAAAEAVKAAAPEVLCVRLLGDGLFSAAIRDELAALLAKPKNIREYLDEVIRTAMTDKPIWPSEKYTRALLLIWLISNPALCGVRFRHKHEMAYKKPSAIMFHRVRRPTE